MKPAHATIALFTLAGVATAPGFMDSCRDELALRLRARGYAVEADSLYPYGDWHRRIYPQLLEIARDLLDIHERLWNAAGMRAVKQRLLHAAEEGRTVVLVGHSGGGVTAVQAASQFVKAGYPAPHVVQIGSPRCPVRPELKPNTLFLSGYEKYGGRKDPIAMLGRWGGWVRGEGTVPFWRKDAHAPAAVAALPLIGGHPDYFRAYAPYIDEEGVSNLDVTLGAVLAWLEPRLRNCFDAGPD
ncbi:lipase family protein [Paenibacillus thalictri]|uniref:lipase family protein n=1 Tax=Paenibacillus thalictri TaxID=2527873 RepID=UPI00197D0C55|nr:hypothetical protein [Paenibacillus thalictri]